MESRLISHGTRQAVEKTAGVMGDTISLDDYRSYAPGMALGRMFTSGPSDKHEEWKNEVQWIAYLRLIAEVVMIIYGLQFQTDESVAGASGSKR